jgi:hypothetical protein
MCNLCPPDREMRPGVTEDVTALYSLAVSSSKAKNIMRLVWSDN